jgi:segregation and condensation protein B
VGLSEDEVVSQIDILSEHYRDHHGLRIQRLNDKYQLTSSPDYALIIEPFLGLEVTSRLTQPALEALAIIAYNQPTTRPEIDAVRGVNSDGVVRSLVSKGLIEELGRSEAPGRPILYGVTSEFLQQFGLDSLNELPPIDFEELISPAQSNGEEKRILKE